MNTANNRPLHVTVDLDAPLSRGGKEIPRLQLRRPKAGELRGLSLAKLCQMDVDETRKLLPRIATAFERTAEAKGDEEAKFASVGGLTINDVDLLDPADMLDVAEAVTDFLLSTQRKAELPTT